MATHSSIVAWRIPWTEEPGRLQSMGLQSQTQLNQLSTSTMVVFITHTFLLHILLLVLATKLYNLEASILHFSSSIF